MHFSADEYPASRPVVSAGHQLPTPRATVEFCSYDNDQPQLRVSHPRGSSNDSPEAVQKQLQPGNIKRRLQPGILNRHSQDEAI
ncbi:MAG: hypothetical protein O2983_06735 [Planctomycetota bacterium]|nr:hypothetical protein [Planctomycetota bacterium]MDA0920558.1 hypothetical protein [Planctomycetota bacterium]MDA1159292.1 hypothetical protein [Planctomycetota bacterium]